MAKTPGLDRLKKAFKTLEKKAATQVLKEVVKAGIVPTLAAIKAEAAKNKDTGTLLKALGSKQKAYKSGSIHFGIIGARAGQKREVIRTFTKRGKPRIKLKKTTLTKRESGKETRDAVHYLHLLNKGRKALKGPRMPVRIKATGKVVFDRSVKEAVGTNFMRKGWVASRSARRTAMKAALKKGVFQAARQASGK